MKRLSQGALIVWFALTSTASICSPVLFAEFAKPLDLGGYGFSNGIAGLLITAEIATLGATAILAGLFSRLTTHSLVRSGLILAAIANVLTVQSTSFAWVLIWRTLAGIGSGWVLIACARTIASHKEPGSLTSILIVTTTILNAAMLFGLGWIARNTSSHMLFYGLSFVFAAGLTLVKVSAQPADNLKAPATEESPLGTQLEIARQDLQPLNYKLLASVLILNIADSGMYSLSSLLGARAGLTEAAFNLALTLTTLAGIASAVAARLFRGPSPRAFGILIGLGFKAIISLTLVRTHGPLPFGASMVLFNLTFFLVTALVFYSAYDLEKTGHLAAKIAGSGQIGSALGPAIAGLLDQTLGARTMSIVIALMICGSAILYKMAVPRRVQMEIN